jgi:hypothetical protein
LDLGSNARLWPLRIAEPCWFAAARHQQFVPKSHTLTTFAAKGAPAISPAHSPPSTVNILRTLKITTSILAVVAQEDSVLTWANPAILHSDFAS